jgi:hypothetical protein
MEVWWIAWAGLQADSNCVAWSLACGLCLHFEEMACVIFMGLPGAQHISLSIPCAAAIRSAGTVYTLIGVSVLSGAPSASQGSGFEAHVSRLCVLGCFPSYVFMLLFQQQPRACHFASYAVKTVGTVRC